MRIDIWSDVVCPWCYIGKKRFDRALAHLAADAPELHGRIEIAYRAYQLDPTAPLDRASPVRDVYARKFGGPERADAIFEQMTATAAAEGVHFDFSRAVRANTARAHRLLWWTLENYGSHAQSALKEDVMAAYFTHGRNIGDVDTLADIAHARLSSAQPISKQTAALLPDVLQDLLRSDLGENEVRIDMETASTNGITGVPTYVIDGQWAIPGAQDTETFERVLRRALERQVSENS